MLGCIYQFTLIFPHLQVALTQKWSLQPKSDNKKVRDQSHAPKSATPIVAKQSSNRKGYPYYHPSGVAFLPNSFRMITKKGYNIPLV